MDSKWKKNYFVNSPLQEFQLTQRAGSERKEIDETEQDITQYN